MSEQYFFDVPIYRCSIDKHSDEMDKEKTRHLKFLTDLHGPQIRNSKTYASAQNYFDTEKWFPWRYNEIIGWIRLYILGCQVRGELWFIRAKRISRNLSKKKFYCLGKGFETNCHAGLSSEQIFNLICSELDHLKEKKPVKGRYLDTELFKNIGRFINWRWLIGFDA